MAATEMYPVRVDASLDTPLSRWLWIVKWVLVIPHYVIVGLFTGSGLWFASRAGYQDGGWGGLGLIGILAVIAAVMLLVTGRYPYQIFDFVLGMNRWALRVAAYAGLMTDKYPPFRLDMGGHDPGTLVLPPPAGASPTDPVSQPETFPPQIGRSLAGGPGPHGWTAARIVSVIAGAVLAVFSIGLLGAGGTALWAQTTQRHGGYVDLGSATYSAPVTRLPATRSGSTWPAAAGTPHQPWPARYVSGSPKLTARPWYSSALPPQRPPAAT